MKLTAAILCCIALAGCGESAPSDQVTYHSRWADQNATDAQIDALIKDMPRPVENWHAKVTNVREDGHYTIIETVYGKQNYYLWMFEADARDKARQMSAQTDIVFSGELVQELSMTRSGARENPEFVVYASRVVGDGLEILQTAEGVAQEHEADRQADERARADSTAENRDSYYESETMTVCKELVIKELMFPVSGEFSWLQAKTRKESETEWVYTDVVTSITDSGKKTSTRFVCTVTIKGDSLEGQVEFLK